MSTVTCTCKQPGSAPYWHWDDCPISALACESCEGKGYHLVQLSCECCTDTETCDDCGGSGIKSN
jgi:hypothetical protein